MAEVDKYISNCPSCDKKIRIPTWHDGKVKCPSCSDVWYPNSQAISQNNMYYTQYNMRPQRRFAMTLGDTIEYGFSMISAVIISILISGAIGYVGFLVITASPEMNEPILGVCFGIGLIAFSSIVFTSLSYGIAVRVVAEGVMVGNIAADGIREEKQIQADQLLAQLSSHQEDSVSSLSSDLDSSSEISDD
jgi:hypothetical protein